MSDLSWETLESSVAYTCGGFDVVNEQVRLPDGQEAPFDYISETESVVILPLTAGGDVVVIEEWRHAVKRRNRGLPAGTLEPDETPEEAAHRELREETGYEAETTNHLTTVEPANGFSDSLFHYFVAEGCEQTADQQLDVDESIEVTTTTMDSLVSAARENELRDGRSALGVLYYVLFENGSESVRR